MFETFEEPDQPAHPYRELIATDLEQAERMHKVAEGMEGTTATVLFQGCEEDPDQIEEAVLLARAYAELKQQLESGEMGSRIFSPEAYEDSVRRNLKAGGAVVWLSIEHDGTKPLPEVSWPFYKRLRTENE